MKYYIFNPIWKDNTRANKWAEFIGDNSICYTKFASIKDGLIAAKLDGTALREQNWEIFECYFFYKKRIMIETLYNQGYLLPKITEDSISKIFYCK